MNEPYFRDYHLLLDEQPDTGATARLVEHTGRQQAASIRKNLPLETMTMLQVSPSGEVYTTKVQFPANLSTGTVHQFGPVIRLLNDTHHVGD